MSRCRWRERTELVMWAMRFGETEGNDGLRACLASMSRVLSGRCSMPGTSGDFFARFQYVSAVHETHASMKSVMQSNRECTYIPCFIAARFCISSRCHQHLSFCRWDPAYIALDCGYYSSRTGKDYTQCSPARQKSYSTFADEPLLLQHSLPSTVRCVHPGRTPETRRQYHGLPLITVATPSHLEPSHAHWR